MENRNGLVVDGRLTRASGVSECMAGIDLADAHIPPGGTLAGDKGFDAADFVAELRERRITPHVAQNQYDTGSARRRSNIDGRTTRHPGYRASQRIRKRIEEIFGWLKTVAGWRKTRFRPDTLKPPRHPILPSQWLFQQPVRWPVANLMHCRPDCDGWRCREAGSGGVADHISAGGAGGLYPRDEWGRCVL